MTSRGYLGDASAMAPGGQCWHDAAQFVVLLLLKPSDRRLAVLATDATTGRRQSAAPDRGRRRG